MASYKPLFNVQVKHSYFTDGRCRPLTFTPLPQTQKWMRGHELLWRGHDGGGTVIVDTDKQALLQQSAAHSPLLWCCRVTYDDPHFNLYTRQSLQQDKGNLVVSFGSLNGEPQLTYPDTATQQKLYGSTVCTNGNQASFLLVVSLDASLLSQLLQAEQAATFAPQFDSKSTCWQYYFVGQWLPSLLADSRQSDAITIEDSQGKACFGGFETVQLPGGIQVLSAKMQGTLPLRQHSQCRPRLCQGDTVLMTNLPCANAAALQRDKDTWVSPIYINQPRRTPTCPR